MIRITIERDRHSQQIVRYTLLGHANFANPGEDIVCAGVSAVAIGTVNAVESLLGIELTCVTDERDGLLKVEVPPQDDRAIQEQLQLLLESMVVMLMSIQESYGKYVKINMITQKRR